MPPRLNASNAYKSLTLQKKSLAVRRNVLCPSVTPSRGFATSKDSKPERSGPNQDVLGHVSEEAADIAKITGETQPDIGQASPVQEVCTTIDQR